jgi:hypothetical protein
MLPVANAAESEAAIRIGHGRVQAPAAHRHTLNEDSFDRDALRIDHTPGQRPDENGAQVHRLPSFWVGEFHIDPSRRPGIADLARRCLGRRTTTANEHKSTECTSDVHSPSSFDQLSREAVERLGSPARRDGIG